MANSLPVVNKQELLNHLAQVMDPTVEGRSTGVKSFVPGHSYAQPQFEVFARAVTAISEDALPEFLAAKHNLRVLNTCAYAASEAGRTGSQNFFLGVAQGLDPKITTCIAEVEDEKFIQSGATRKSGWSSVLTGGEAKTYRDAFSEEEGRGAA